MKNRSSDKNPPMQKVVDGLAHFLADTYTLYLKTQNFHWNVRGPHFHSLHKMFEEQYQALAEAVDVIAERIRALKSLTPASFAQFLRLTSLEENENAPNAEEMIRVLLNDHQTIIKNGQSLFAIAQKAGDEVTGDLLLARLDEHEKTAWMLRSTLNL